MFTLVLIIKLYALVNIVTAKNALFNITCESSSKCGNVVIENEDKFNCFTEIDEDFKKNNITEYSLRFYVETKNTHIERNNATHDCQVMLNKGCQKEEKKDCSCTGNYYIDWNLTALYEKHNNARIQARLFNSSSRTIYSNFHPGARIIKDSRNVTFMLFVNNKEVPDNGIINIAKDDDEILFNISSKELSDVLRLHYEVNDQITSGQKIRVKPQNITLKIKLCDRELRSYNLSLLYDDLKPTTSNILQSSTKTSLLDADKASNCSLDVWIGLVAVLSFIIFGLLILLLNVTPEVIVIYLVGRHIYGYLRRNHRQCFQEYQKIFALKVAQEITLPKFTNDNYDVENLNNVLEKENNKLNVRNYILFLTKWNLEMENCRGIMQRKQELENRKTDIQKCNDDFQERIQNIGNWFKKLPNFFPISIRAQWRKDLVNSLKEIENVNLIEELEFRSNQSEVENSNPDYETWIEYLESRNKYLLEDNSKLLTSNIRLEDIIKQLANEAGDSRSERSPLITDSQSNYPI